MKTKILTVFAFLSVVMFLNIGFADMIGIKSAIESIEMSV